MFVKLTRVVFVIGRNSTNYTNTDVLFVKNPVRFSSSER